MNPNHRDMATYYNSQTVTEICDGESLQIGLIDSAFQKICNSVNDSVPKVRAQVLRQVGRLAMFKCCSCLGLQSVGVVRKSKRSTFDAVSEQRKVIKYPK
jgi:hypothetical protein